MLVLYAAELDLTFGIQLSSHVLLLKSFLETEGQSAHSSSDTASIQQHGPFILLLFLFYC